jgi:two-component system, NtrC family, sensor kinase
MDRTGSKLRLSFQLKVLVPVLTALVLVPALTLWIVNGYITRQVQNEAGQTLTTAETVFRQSLEIRSRDLITRFRSAVNESSYHSLGPLLSTRDNPQAAETIRGVLEDRLKDYGADYEALILTAYPDSAPVTVRRNATGEIEGLGKHGSDPDPGAGVWTVPTRHFTRLALQGDSAHGTLQLNGQVYLIVSVPVMSSDNVVVAGALTVASRIGEPTLQELKSLTGAEILIMAGDNLTASTLRQSDLPDSLFKGTPTSTLTVKQRIVPLELQGQHYLALTDNSDHTDPQQGFRYALLVSLEDRLHDLKSTQMTLLAVSVLGMLVCGLVVWGLIRRITQPLVELRDNAEAVGRGDFTRRIEQFSNDECGEVAEAFNRMTENLQTSRTDLEKAVATVKTTQAQLIQSEKLSAVGQFVAGIAHELNNPLTTVIGFSELLQYSNIDPKFKGHVSQIANGATRCHKIVHSLLGFARQHEPERKLASLHDIVDAVLEFLAYDMRTNNITIVREYARELPPILADSHQLQQVILNILSNARQAIEAFRRDGRIVLRTGANATHVWLRIIDNGPGMSRETLSRIFDPFFTTKPQGKGTGLGLSLSYGIVKEHQGTIRAESEPGKGAEFIIELPIAQTAATAVAAKNGSGLPFRTQLEPLRVLVVDDEEPILYLVQEVLRADGHNVDTATSGQAGLKLASENPYDVIVTDWKMPGLNGMQMHEDLMARDPAAARRMLFMTGDVIRENFQEFLKKYSLTCLPKPFSIGEFQAAIIRLRRGK